MNKKSILSLLVLAVVSIALSSVITYRITNNQAESSITQLKTEVQNLKKANIDVENQNSDLIAKNSELLNQNQSLAKKLNFYTQKK